jgi:hypothetical protein
MKGGASAVCRSNATNLIGFAAHMLAIGITRKLASSPPSFAI